MYILFLLGFSAKRNFKAGFSRVSNETNVTHPVTGSISLILKVNIYINNFSNHIFHHSLYWLKRLSCQFLSFAISFWPVYIVYNSNQAYTCHEHHGSRNISRTLLGHAWLMTFVKTKAFQGHSLTLTCFSTIVRCLHCLGDAIANHYTIWCAHSSSGESEWLDALVLIYYCFFTKKKNIQRRGRCSTKRKTNKHWTEALTKLTDLKNVLLFNK